MSELNSLANYNDLLSTIENYEVNCVFLFGIIQFNPVQLQCIHNSIIVIE